MLIEVKRQGGKLKFRCWAERVEWWCNFSACAFVTLDFRLALFEFDAVFYFTRATTHRAAGTLFE